MAYQQVNPKAIINTDFAGLVKIAFGPAEPTSSIGAITVETIFGNIMFHVLDKPTPCSNRI
ncbi:uncharacterized protein FA14DRAFT_161667 [Meira miltonrushii]|uniref:Uncharacterized protein n=1 Tax=Meira miltonrushii TaxID=1280837 RepID=A0A316VA74_9BASI|nr:uncharacterized protein FA14DRAFT_161667 [Meira miltonrushii]PWN34174.1 hypothetical protein FA14DRAFT_161667 [Meira miltonrushii]